MTDKLEVHRSWRGSVGVLRLHVGLENPGDLINDLSRAIDAVLKN